MREISLEDLHAELLKIKVLTDDAGASLEDVLEQVGRDVEDAEESRHEGMEPERKRPLSVWWKNYPNLKDLIGE